eukprot:TRINITY_DN16660_c0_g1_i1.p1 TRINITY_DN16660_c0_g1~~TRINITY_DN16660_c0_g1_i1.p1  ORF type:complete len:207 (-),score=27.34 TRINITY_DN16660_c0_g1_i1:65-685(-)
MKIFLYVALVINLCFCSSFSNKLKQNDTVLSLASFLSTDCNGKLSTIEYYPINTCYNTLDVNHNQKSLRVDLSGSNVAFLNWNVPGCTGNYTIFSNFILKECSRYLNSISFYPTLTNSSLIYQCKFTNSSACKGNRDCKPYPLDTCIVSVYNDSRILHLVSPNSVTVSLYTDDNCSNHFSNTTFTLNQCDAEGPNNISDLFSLSPL